ncbi:MAG: hypothetical protein OJJ54_17640 [Pseudonocardia sp.]|nr:hypothetical protein [Pseudonocardia sp.]
MTSGPRSAPGRPGAERPRTRTGRRIRPAFLQTATGLAAAAVVLAACTTGTPPPPPAPGPAPPPSAAPGAPRLTWAPPVLNDPQTVELEAGMTTTMLDPAKDYILKIPRTGKGDTFIRGGHNIVMIGGHISTGSEPPPWDAPEHRALYFADTTGTIHIEGVLIDDKDSGQGDGIDAAAPLATLQIENVRITGLTGSEQGNHADVVQPWGGLKELRIDRLTGATNYQGLHIQPDLAPIGTEIVKNANVSSTSSTAGNWLMWLVTGSNTCSSAGSVRLDEVYVTPRSGRGLGDSVWPPNSATNLDDAPNPVQSCLSSVSPDGSEVTFPGLPQVSGSVRKGPPPDGDFVPDGVAGADYLSPGYVGR